MAVEVPFDNGNGLIRGDAFTRTIVVRGIPTGDAVDKARLTVKQNLTDEDIDAEFQKEIAVILSADGQLLDTGNGSGIAKLAFLILSADTLLLSPDAQYWWDVQIQMAGGDIITVIKGRAVAAEEVTKTNTP
jgi:hypothetical protein